MLENMSSFFTTGQNWVFIIFSILVIGGALYMLSFTKIVHMVVSMAFTFLSLAGLYVLLEAEFVAVVQVLVYAGAISILMIFGIMMTRHTDDHHEKEYKRPAHHIFVLIGVIGLFGILLYAIQSAEFPTDTTFNAGADNTKAIGELIYTQHVIPFELVSVLLTVAFIGAIVLAKKEEE